MLAMHFLPRPYFKLKSFFAMETLPDKALQVRQLPCARRLAMRRSRCCWRPKNNAHDAISAVAL